MDKSLVNRLKNLEKRSAPPWRWVLKNEGETDDDAKQREGVKPDESSIVYSRLDLDV